MSSWPDLGSARRSRAARATVLLALLVLLKAGARAAPWPEDEPAPTDASAHEALARVVRGDAERGKVVFHGDAARCAECHTDSEGERKVGPDLRGIVSKYPVREELLRHVLEPSATILPGYATTVVVRRTGEVVQGILERRDDSRLVLVDAQAKRHEVPASDVIRLTSSEVSIMPAELWRSVSPAELCDLLAYLESLEAPSIESLAPQGTPERIEPLARPVAIRPLHGDDVRFDQPVFVDAYPGGDGALLVLEHRRARAWLLEESEGVWEKRLFADLSSEVSDGPWEGLVCVAFHRRFRDNRRYFVKHETIEDGRRKTCVVERRAREDLSGDSGEPARRLLEIPQPADNHNGGTAIFGPDGYLYLAMGDGGPQRDPTGLSQDPGRLLGAMLRIDVDRRDPGKGYAVPEDNPFVGRVGHAPEVWAIGFREPWRFSFDPATGDLWLGDVGQDRFEEVAIVRRGENHGWNVYEGFASFSDEFRREGEVFVPPVVSLRRQLGVSVTGGHVYRGDRNASFEGVYIFGDFETRRVWGLTQKDRRLEAIREIGQAPAKIASFGLDHAGELLIAGYDGVIYRIDLTGARFE